MALPSWDDEPLPKMDFSRSEAHIEWQRRERAMIHERRRVRRERRVRYSSALSAVRALEDRPLFFVHRADARQRLYPTGSSVHPQSFDLARGMLRFAHGEEVKAGTEAERSFLLSGANLAGFDKLPFDQRLERIAQLEGDIRRIPRDPTGERWWQELDDPWQFLGWAYEAAELFERGSVVSHHPCRLDGSTNAAQIAALLMRDSQLAQWTNLTQSDAPFDLYAQVATAVRDELHDSDDPLAVTWLEYLGGEVPRKLPKQPVMTDLYGVTSHGVIGQVDAWYAKHKERTGKPLPIRDPFPALIFMSRVLRTTIETHLASSFLLKGFVQDVASALAAQGIDLDWTAPTGFPVRSRYRKADVRTVNLPSSATVRRIRRAVSWQLTDELKRKKSRNASVPNLIHSLDSSVLVTVVRRLKELGVPSVTTIHDAFGVHATHVETLRRVVLDTLAEMFSEPILEQWLDEVRSLAKDSDLIPALPALGDFDVEAVREATYAFS